MLRHSCPSVLRSARNLRCLFLLGTLLCLLITSSAQAANRLVPSQYATIQAAIDAAAVGDTVLLADGTYTGGGNKNLNFGGKDIIVRSASGDPTRCIIDCQNGGRGFFFHNGETATAAVSGLTVQNANILGDVGGGMCLFSGSPTISQCIFTGNKADYGAGVYIYSSSNSTVSQCLFIDNTAHTSDGSHIRYAGGMWIESNGATVTNCTFAGNMADSGGGIAVFQHSPTITNCTFNGNTANYGGGIYSESSNPTVTNCTFAENSAVAGGGMYLSGSSPIITNCNFTGNLASGGGGMDLLFSDPTVTNCTFAGNSASFGGGILNADTDDIGPTFANCAFIGNSVSDSLSGGIFNYKFCYMTVTNCTFTGNAGAILDIGIMTITNCILWGDTDSEYLGFLPYTVITDCDMQGSPATPDANGNFGADPLFVRNPFTNGPTDYGDLHLQYTSPCFNAGNNAALPLSITTDLDGNPRIAFGTVDLGAYELQAATIVSGQVQVTRSGFRRNATTGRYVQTVTLKNIGASAIKGPISLVLDNLSGNATLYSKTGNVGFLAPIGSSYQNTAGLNPGASAMLTLEFTNSTNAAITYTTRVLAGAGAR